MKRKKQWFVALVVAGLAARIVTAIINYGYLAIDDYYILYFSVPAQSPLLDSLTDTFTIPGVRSFVPEYLVRIIGRLAYSFGFEDPLSQIRFIFVTLGIFSISSMLLGYFLLKSIFSEAENSEKDWKGKIPLTGLFLLSLHFIMPLVSTRALIEMMSAPFILASVYCMTKYWKSGSNYQLSFSVFWLAIASTFRFQAGVCIFALVGFVIYRSWKEKSYQDWIFLTASGIFSFVLTGLPDLLLRDGFHSSLIQYVEYNLHSASNYGTSPWYGYIPSLILLTIPPVLIGKYKGFPWKSAYRDLLPSVAYVAVFLIFHSAIPHKEERFLLPVLPVFLVLLAPLFAYWMGQKGAIKYWRAAVFGILNFLLLFTLMFSVMQENAIGVVRYLHFHKKVNEVYSYRDSLNHLPISYAYRDPWKVQEMVAEIDSEGKPKIKDFSYSANTVSLLAVREDYYKEGVRPSLPWKQVRKFDSSPLETIAIRLNPKRNRRRSPLIIFECEGCGKAKVQK